MSALTKATVTVSPPPEQVCFVISPIGAEGTAIRARSDLVLKEIITPAARTHSLTVLRSDFDRRPGVITSQIIRYLLNSRMVVADLTDSNANVFYELALRHAFRKPVVQLKLKGQIDPFDTHSLRTIEYSLPSDASTPERLTEVFYAIEKARETVEAQIGAALEPGYEVESTVTMAAQLEELTRTGAPETRNVQILESILEQVGNLNKTVANMSGLVCRPEHLKDAIPPMIQSQVESVLHAYSEEISILKDLRQAGLRGIFKRRAFALEVFSTALGEEEESIMVVGSSLKGLLQKEEYKELSEKLRFKCQYVPVRFLLTHPIIADLRAKQEGRALGEIGREIVKSLNILHAWGVKPENVRLYLGTPTCFAIRTSKMMLLNPYPYISTSFDSPCFIFEKASGGGPEATTYFYDEFNIRHFGAWESELSVPVRDLAKAANVFEGRSGDYSSRVNDLLKSGKEDTG